MVDQQDYAPIAALDLDPIKVKLMHAASGEGWSLDKATAVEREYRRFLYLMKKFPGEQTAPLFDVDTFWHYHILDTLKYATDCAQVFGYFLHHFPYIGLRGEDDTAAHHAAGARMQELYEATFGEPYLRAEASAFSGAAQAVTAFSGAAQAGTAFSGAAQAQPAFSGAVQAATAFSGVAQAQPAFSGAVQAATAFSGAAQAATAFSGAAQARTAFSGILPRTAFSGRTTAEQTAQLSSFYTTRPSLKPSA